MNRNDYRIYGDFDCEKHEFVIKDPFTPMPWINYLSNGSLTTIISQKAGGMTFLDSSSDARFTRYRMTRSIPMDRPGPYVYLRESDGKVWSPSFEPVRAKLDSWSCRHGMGYTEFESELNGLKASIRYFVSPESNVLIWDLKLSNHRSKEVQLFIVPYVEFSFLDAAEEAISFHWSRMQSAFTYDPSLGAVKYEYMHMFAPRKIKVFLSSNAMPDSFDADRDIFMGRRGTEEYPEKIVAGKLGNSELPGGGHGAGALGFNRKIAPDDEIRLMFCLGGAESWTEADKLIRKYKNIEEADADFEKLRDFYQKFLSVFNASLPDKNMEEFINIWNPYNCLQTFNLDRSASAVHTGMGSAIRSRDNMQDALAVSCLNPDMARPRIKMILSYQLPEGRFFNGFNPLSAKEPDGTHRRSDNAVWSVYTIHAYICETGEYDFLDENINYYKGKAATVIDHLWQGIQYIVSNSGQNGLPLMFDCDWNDSLYLFRGDGVESVMLAENCVYACRLLEEMALNRKRADIAAFCQETALALDKILNSQVVWNGKWYNRLIFPDDRIPLGHWRRREAALFLNTQSWAIISGTAHGDRAEKCMQAVKERLLTDLGFKLLTPPYTGIPEPEDPLITNVPGVGENGGIFNHANAWAIIALALQKDRLGAFEAYRNCLPFNVIDKVGVDKYLNEPYCWSSHLIADPDYRKGMGLLSWLTGTASWMYVAATQYLLGIKPVFGGIKIEPCLPAEWNDCRIKRKFRNGEADIYIHRETNHLSGRQRLLCNDKDVNGNVISETLFHNEGKVKIDVFFE